MCLRPRRLLVAFVLLTASASAQEQRASIEGAVRDSSGAPVPGVPVTVRSAAGLAITATSDDAGYYRFPSLAPGRYELEVMLAGFAPARIEDVDLLLGQTLRVDLALSPAQVRESVTVAAKAPLIDVTQSARSTHIRDEQIAKLPRGRDFTSLITQAPGANAEGYWEFGGISIDGSSGSENRFVIDGIETTDLIHGNSGMRLVTDFVEEVQVKSSGYAAEYGGATGAVINVITRTGTNDWAGEVGTYYFGEWLEGRVRPFLLRMPDGSPAYEIFRKDDFDRWEPGLMLRGPIRKDAAWFFASYQPVFLSTRRTVTFRSNRQTATFANANRRQNASANVTGQLGNKTRARASLNMSPSVRDGGLPFIHGFGPSDPANFLPVTYHASRSLSGSIDHVATRNLFLSLRLAQWRNNTRQEGIHQGPRYVFLRSNLGMAEVPADLQGPQGTSNVLTNLETTRDIRRRTSLQLEASAFASAAGRHAVKAGVQLDRLANDVLKGATGHHVILFWGDFFEGQRGQLGYYTFLTNPVMPQRGHLLQGDVRMHNAAVFVQDTWTVADRLTLNLGLRAEREQVPSYTTADGIASTAIGFGFGKKLAPRAGAAWDLRGDGRWKVYGSWGLFYDTMKYDLPITLFGGSKAQQYWYTLDTPDWRSLAPAGCPPACPGRLIRGPVNLAVPANDAIDPDVRPFRLQEAAVGVEHALARSVSVGVRYVHKQVDRALETIGAIDAAGDQVFIIGNPGFGRAAQTGFGPAFPKAVRNYDALEVVFDKRMAAGFALRMSYLWSRLYGNYTGLAHEAEGSPQPNWGDVFDHPVTVFGEDGRPVLGPLASDRPHQFKAHAIRDFRFGTSVGASIRAMSGTPVTREASFFPVYRYPVFYRGRKSDGRLPPLSQVDLHVQHEVKLAREKRLQLSVNVLNVFDQATAVLRYPFEFIDAVDIGQAEFFRGFDMDQLAASQRIRRDPMFLMDYGYQLPREVQLGLRLLF